MHPPVLDRALDAPWIHIFQIRDRDGMDNATLSYQWLADDVEVTGATSSRFTVTSAEQGKTLKVRVTFTDDRGAEETVTSVATQEVRRPNVRASGKPIVLGTLQVGQTLTADVSGIRDGNGLTNPTFHYYWEGFSGPVRYGKEYTLVESDEGSCDYCYLRVTFHDDEGYHEQVNSVDIGVVAPRANSPATGAPVVTGTVQVGETLTADTTGIADADGLTNVSYSYQWISNDGSKDTDITSATGSSYTLVADDEGKTIKVRVSFRDDVGEDDSLTSTATDMVSHAIQQQTSNSPATGAPVITGTAQVGETLTADTTGIADADGLDNDSFSYQWVANDGTSDTDIAGATDSTYTLVADDEGKTIKVRVSFTDDAGNAESLTSAATDKGKVRQWGMSVSWSCGIVDWTNLDLRGCNIERPVVFGVNLREAVNDDDPSTVDYVLRMDMLHENGTDANECEGTNMGADFEVTTVDDEVVIGSGSLGNAGCEPGVYKLRFSAREGASATWHSMESHELWLRRPNEAAMGRPAIAGAAQVGETNVSYS